MAHSLFCFSHVGDDDDDSIADDDASLDSQESFYVGIARADYTQVGLRRCHDRKRLQMVNVWAVGSSRGKKALGRIEGERFRETQEAAAAGRRAVTVKGL